MEIELMEYKEKVTKKDLEIDSLKETLSNKIAKVIALERNLANDKKPFEELIHHNKVTPFLVQNNTTLIGNLAEKAQLTPDKKIVESRVAKYRDFYSTRTFCINSTIESTEQSDWRVTQTKLKAKYGISRGEETLNSNHARSKSHRNIT